MNLDELFERLEKVRTLAEEGATEGERTAAKRAEEKLQARIDERSYANDPKVEYRFSIHDPWKRRLFLAVCRRHDIDPFRYKRQKRQSVMVRAPERFIDNILWPEYPEMAEILTDYLDDATSHPRHRGCTGAEGCRCQRCVGGTSELMGSPRHRRVE